MSVALYMDEHISGVVTKGLRLRGVDVVTAQDDGHGGSPDDLLLDRAMALGRVVYSEDDDFLAIASARQQSGTDFAGVVFSQQQTLPIGKRIDDLELIAKATDPNYCRNRVQYLPL